jgi:hypothetical protein
MKLVGFHGYDPQQVPMYAQAIGQPQAAAVPSVGWLAVAAGVGFIAAALVMSTGKKKRS